MNYKTFLKSLILVALAAALLLVLPSVSSQVKHDGAGKNQNQDFSLDADNQPRNITLTIEGVLPKQQISLPTEQTALQLLQEIDKTNSQLRLTTKEYKGLGILVEGMGGITNGAEGKYWQYKVNGVMPQVGADQYILKDGDTVEWYFAPSSS